MNELWVSARRQVHKAQIALDVGAKLACEVHNGSRSGATLRLNRAFDVPSWFRLHMQGGLTFGCTVIRRSRVDIGVRFDSA